MFKCAKHDVWFRAPVGCWKCHEEAEISIHEFVQAKGPQFNSINNCDHSGEKKLCTCKTRELLANIRNMQGEKDAST